MTKIDEDWAEFLCLGTTDVLDRIGLCCSGDCPVPGGCPLASLASTYLMPVASPQLWHWQMFPGAGRHARTHTDTHTGLKYSSRYLTQQKDLQFEIREGSFPRADGRKDLKCLQPFSSLKLESRFVCSSYRFLLPEWTRKLLWPIFSLAHFLLGH